MSTLIVTRRMTDHPTDSHTLGRYAATGGYEQARREVDFIKRYIFPGSCIPSRAILARAAAATDLTPVQGDEIGLHYAETLRRWRLNMLSRRDDVRAPRLLPLRSGVGRCSRSSPHRA